MAGDAITGISDVAGLSAAPQSAALKQAKSTTGGTFKPWWQPSTWWGGKKSDKNLSWVGRSRPLTGGGATSNLGSTPKDWYYPAVGAPQADGVKNLLAVSFNPHPMPPNTSFGGTSHAIGGFGTFDTDGETHAPANTSFAGNLGGPGAGSAFHGTGYGQLAGSPPTHLGVAYGSGAVGGTPNSVGQTFQGSPITRLKGKK